MKSSEFVYFHLLYYKCLKINLNCGGPYIDSPDWIKNKKITISPINKKDKCFQYAVTLNREEIKKIKRIMKINFFIIKYNSQEISFPSEKKMIGKNL